MQIKFIIKNINHFISSKSWLSLINKSHLFAYKFKYFSPSEKLFVKKLYKFITEIKKEKSLLLCSHFFIVLELGLIHPELFLDEVLMVSGLNHSC